MPPAARLTDMHTCPMVDGIVPHVGGPIVAPGEPTVLIGFLPAARVTDQAICVGPPDMIAMGSPTVLIGGLMAARLGDPTEHGGVIVLGEPTVIIGEVGMGGAGTAIGMGMAMAQTSAVACPSDNPSKYSVPAAPAANIAPPASFYKAQEAAASPDPASSPAAVQDAGPAANGANNAIAPDVVKEIVCGLTPGSVQIHCQHKGRVPKNGLLQVVGSLGGGDTITCSSSIIGTCGQHPTWEIGGYWESEKTGTNTSFNARDFQLMPGRVLALPVWLGDADPHVYNVSVASCSGPSYSFEIDAYPSDSQEVTIDLGLYKETLDPIREGVTDVLKLVIEHPKFEFLKGTGKANLQWKEDDKSNVAFYSWQLSAGFAPLIGFGFRVPLGPFAIPAAVSDLGLGGGFFFEAKGEVSIQLEGGQLGPPDSDAGHFDLKSESSVIFSVLGSVFVGDEDDPVISVEVAVSTGITLEFTGKLEEYKPVVEGGLKVGGLKGNCTFHFFLYDKKTECTFFEETEIWDGEFHPFASKESVAPGGDL